VLLETTYQVHFFLIKTTIY